MIGFDIASQDQSVYYLGQLFGYVGNILPSENGSLLLGTMFKTLNTTALAVGGVIIAHTIIVGLLKTASEGEFLGRQWSSLWIPLRTVLGIVALFPTSTGYSLIQIALMWIILQGVGAADALWTTVLNYITLAGSPYNGVSLPTSVSIEQQMNNLFKALTCEATAVSKPIVPSPNGPGSVAGYTYIDKYDDPDRGPSFYYYCAAKPQDPFCTSTSPQLNIPLSPPAPTSNYGQRIPGTSCTVYPGRQEMTKSPIPQSFYAPGKIRCDIGPGGACGYIEYGNFTDACTRASSGDMASILQCASYKGQTQALRDVTAILEGTAANFARYDHDYLAFTENTSLSPPLNYPFPNPPIVVRPPPVRYNIKNGLRVPIPTKPTVPAANGWIVPSWINNYCQTNNNGVVDPCCVRGLVKAPGQTCDVYNTNTFPAPFVIGNPTDKTNPSTEAINNVLWPYALQPSITGGAGGSNTVNFIASSVSQYTGAINKALIDAMTTAAPALPAGSWQEKAQGLGWIMAGSYYYRVAQDNNNNLDKSIPPFEVVGIDPHTSQTPNILKYYRSNFTAATTLLSTIAQQNASSGGYSFASAPQLAEVGSSLNGLASSIVGSFMNTLSGGGSGEKASNPLVAIQGLGEVFLITAQTFYAVFLTLAIVLLIVSSIDPMVLGTGLTQNPMEAAISFTMYTIWALVMLVIGWMFMFGGILAVYTPMIPYIIFTFGAIGWLTATVEAMVAAPFVALGILSPNGQHEIMGRAEPSIMIMLNIFLRPSLMIMGMMVAMLMAPIVVTMINAGFKGVMGAILPDPGIAELIFFLSAYCMLIITALNKCFAMIHLLPTRVLVWIGGQAISYGEEEGLQGVKGGMDTAIGGVASGSKGSFAAVQKKADDKAKPDKKKGNPSVK